MNRCLLLLIAFATGCPAATGQRCDPRSPCPSGYVCLDFATGESRCTPTCTEREQCASRRCIEFMSPGFCDDVNGSVPLGAACSVMDPNFGRDDCAAGLRCDARGICHPSCSADSPHSIDRACAGGTICDLRSLEQSVCRATCDADANTGCVGDERCIRYARGDDVFAVCEPENATYNCADAAGTRCASDETCVNSTCYPSATAPPREWVDDPRVPALVD